jgi:hypothetical protein
MNEPIAYPQAAQHAVFFGAGRPVRQGGGPTTRTRTDDLPAGRYDRRGGRR